MTFEQHPSAGEPPAGTIESSVASRWLAVQQLVSAACHAAGRDPKEVTIVGVTKYVDAETTRALWDAGCADLGESRPQSLWEKASALAPREVRWHMIGHLQRNKIAQTLPHLTMLHSLDSERLAEAVSAACVAQARQLDCLIEANISGDETKTGLPPTRVPAFAQFVRQLPGLRICGLMGMAGLNADESQAATQFSKLRILRDRLQHTYGGDFHPFSELSMGMSRDFHTAITEGATIVRIGSSLFPQTPSP